MIYLDPSDIDASLDCRVLIEDLRKAHRCDEATYSQRLLMEDPSGNVGKFISLLAWSPGDVIATKLVGVFPGNPNLETPQPSVQGLVALFDARTGRPLMVCDGAALTFYKTAADSALGADHLARHDAETLLVIGAGGLAPHVIKAHCCIRPGIKRVMIWNRTDARARELARKCANAGVDVQSVTDLDAAVGKADIISSVTMSTEPLIKGRFLRPGTHVDLIGAYLPDMREADDDVLARGALFVDTREGCLRSGDLASPIANGIITAESVRADLFDLCSGRHPGRTDPQSITVYKNVGGGHLDLITARCLLSGHRPVA